MASHTDSFWEEKVKWMNSGDKTSDGQICVRIEGNHYVIGDEGTTGMRGSGGMPAAIKFTSGPHKGKTIQTTNLWNQGDIPKEYLTKLPDNAEFTKLDLSLLGKRRQAGK